jgi:Carboxypeptidase regulatory-like domain
MEDKASIFGRNEMKLFRLSAVVMVLMMTVSARAQLSTAALFGSVTDNTGAVVPNATVTLTQIETNFTRIVRSDDQGEYRAEFLPIGSYTAKVEAGSFQPFEQKGIMLTATQHARCAAKLPAGGKVKVVPKVCSKRMPNKITLISLFETQ